MPIPKLWIFAPALYLFVASASACSTPCERDPSKCSVSPSDPVSRSWLRPEQAEAELEDIHAAYALAAADGLSAGECKALTASYQDLFERDRRLLVARFNVGAVHEACGEVEQAEAIYIELSKREFPQALNNLGVLAWSRGEHDRAFKLFERSIAADRLHTLEARNNLAMALRERYASKASVADFEQAELQLQNILAVDSANKIAYENLARLYYDRGRRQDRSYLVLANLVVTQAQRVLEASDQRSADLHNLRGLLLMEDNDQIRALRAFKQAVEVESGHVDANRNIAMIAIRFRDYETAERSLESVIDDEVVAADVDAWIALGVAQRGLRKFDAAEQSYRRALEVDASDPRPWFNLGILAQEHLSGEALESEEALTETYRLAHEYFETFVSKAGTSKKWSGAVAEAKDRMVVVLDSIDTIEKMKIVQAEYERILELEKQQRLEEIERLKALEKQGTSVGELVGQGSST